MVAWLPVSGSTGRAPGAAGSAARRAAPTRRTVLRAGLVLPLAACTAGREAPAPLPPPDPDRALRAAAVDRERALLAAYDAALLATPSRAALLRPLREEHAAHLEALLALDPARTSAPPGAGSGSGRPGAPPGTAAPAPPAPAAPVDLAAAEAAASTAHADAVPAASRGLAGLLASLAAAEASHGVALA